VRAEAETRLGSEVAEDAAVRELLVDTLEARSADGGDAAAARGVARARHVEAGVVQELRQERRLPERVRPDPLDPDLLDQVVTGRGRVERRHVRRPRQEAGDPLRVLE